MLLLVLATVICGALAAPAPQLEALEPQPGTNTRFVPLVVQVPEATPGIFAPVVVSAPTGQEQETKPGNSAAVVFLVDNSQAEVSALVNGTTTAGDHLLTVTEATEVAEEVTVEIEQTTDVPAILVEDIPQDEVLASVDAIETVRQQAEAVIADDVAEVVAIVEQELKAEAQLEESVSEAVAVEKAIEATDAQSVVVSVQESNGPAVKTETKIIATEEVIEAIDQAVAQQIQEAAVTQQDAEIAIEEKVADIELTVEMEQTIETAILEQANGASVIEEAVKLVNKKPKLELTSNNELTGKSLLTSTSLTDEAVTVEDAEPEVPLPDALSEADTQVKETPAVLVSEVVPAIGGIVEVISGGTQEEPESISTDVRGSIPEVLIEEKEIIAESSASKDPSEILIEQQVIKSVSKTLDEVEQAVVAAEEVISAAEGSVTDIDSITTEEQTIVHLEPVAIVLDNVVAKGKAISVGQIGASEALSVQAVQEETPVSLTVEEVVATEFPVPAVEVIVDSAAAGEEIIVEEVSTGTAQDEISVAKPSSTTLEQILSEQAPDTTAVVIIPAEFTEEQSQVLVQQEEASGTSTVNQAKEIAAEATIVAEEGSTNADGAIEVAIGSSSPVIDANTETVDISSAAAEQEILAAEAASADSEGRVDSEIVVELTDAEVTATASDVTPVESVPVVKTPGAGGSVTVAEISAPVDAVETGEASGPVETVAAVETSAAVESVGAVDSSLAKSQTAAEEKKSVSESASPSQITADNSQPTVTQSKQLPTPAQQNLLVGRGGRVVFGTSTFGSSISPANFIIGQPVRVPQQVALDLAARSSRRTGTDQARSVVGPRFQQFIFDNDSPDVVAAKVNFFRARAASLGAPLALSVQPMAAAAADPTAVV